MITKEKNELLTTLWDDPSVTLLGFKKDIVSSIDRDQAVDDYGVALYDSYQFFLPYETDDDLLLFSAEDLEAFARTW
ncbi:MAG: hypothetical protein ACLVIZ_07815, partial [Bifidobacterium pseudocatenulatum]